jgi:hypothetical protein
MKTKVETITPQVAKSYLLRNTHNRTPKPTMIEEFAREMRAGRWALTHQGIAFDEENVLLDGQNRLLAIMEAGVSVEMPVTRGIPKTVRKNGVFTMDVIDTGKNRTTADQLHVMHGVENANVTAAACRVVGMICFGAGFEHRLTVGQAKGILELYGKEIAAILERVSSLKPARRAPVIATLAFCAKVTREPIYELAEKLATGEGLKKGDPILTLRNHLINRMMAGGHKNARAVAEWVGNAAYNHIQGNDLKTIKRGHNGLDFFRAKQRGNVERIRQIGGAVAQ